MQEVASPYRRENGTSLIEIKLGYVHQLFNSFDPSPFHEKDLDPEAESYIVGATREFPIGAPLKLVFYLPPEQMALAAAVDLAGSIHNYFDYRLKVTTRDLSFQLRQGRLSLVIGLGFLIACIVLRQVFFAHPQDMLSRIVAEGLLISGWVAMWRPINIFLYDWWPVRRQARVYAKLSRMQVETRVAPSPPPAAPAPPAA